VVPGPRGRQPVRGRRGPFPTATTATPSADRTDGLLLAGDVGGTKTVLGTFSEDRGPGRPLAVKTYPSGTYPGLDAIAQEFPASVHVEVRPYAE
jgi:Glucokinase